MAHPLEHFIINSPKEVKEIIGKFILRAHKRAILKEGSFLIFIKIN